MGGVVTDRSRVNLQRAVLFNELLKLKQKIYAFCITILTLFSVTENPKRTSTTRSGVRDGLDPALPIGSQSIILPVLVITRNQLHF